MAVEIQELQNKNEFISYGHEDILADGVEAILAKFTPSSFKGLEGVEIGYQIDPTIWVNGGIIKVRVGGRLKFTFKQSLTSILFPLFLPIDIHQGQEIEVTIIHSDPVNVYIVDLIVRLKYINENPEGL